MPKPLIDLSANYFVCCVSNSSQSLKRWSFYLVFLFFSVLFYYPNCLAAIPTFSSSTSSLPYTQCWFSESSLFYRKSSERISFNSTWCCFPQISFSVVKRKDAKFYGNSRQPLIWTCQYRATRWHRCTPGRIFVCLWTEDKRWQQWNV